MDFNLVLLIILGVVCIILLPVSCFLTCSNQMLNRLRNLLFVFYVITLFVGVTCQIQFDGNIVKINYEFTKIWGNKDMLWGFENLTALGVFLNLAMLMPLGSYIASSTKVEKPWWQTVLLACFVGLVVSLFIEAMQFALPVNRSVEFSDTLLNTISAGLGALLIVVLRKPRKFIQQKIYKKKDEK